MDSSTKIENSVIKYSPSCGSKPVGTLFIFRTQIKIFFLKMNEGLTALERHEGEYLMTEFSFMGELSL